jgi:hypothetical protein
MTERRPPPLAVEGQPVILSLVPASQPKAIDEIQQRLHRFHRGHRSTSRSSAATCAPEKARTQRNRQFLDAGSMLPALLTGRRRLPAFRATTLAIMNNAGHLFASARRHGQNLPPATFMDRGAISSSRSRTLRFMRAIFDANEAPATSRRDG